MSRATWVVYVVAPRKRDGQNWRILARPPVGSKLRELRKTAGTRDRAEAEALAEVWQRELNVGVVVDEDPTVAQIWERHLVTRGPQLSPETVETYKRGWPRLRETIGAIRASKLDRAAILRARDALEARGLNAKTINLNINQVGVAWGWAHERGLVPAPWPRVKRLRVIPTKKRPFTDDEVVRVLAALEAGTLPSGRVTRGRWAPLFALLATTGCRIGEALSLRGADLDREACTVRVSGKTGARTCAVPTEVLARLHATPEQLVFRSPAPWRAGEPPDRVTLLVALRKAVVAAGIVDRDRVDVHSFRRAWITSAHRAGVPMALSMRQVGHVTTAMHLHYQRRAADDNLGPAVEQVAARRRRPSTKRPESSTGTEPQPVARPQDHKCLSDPAPSASAPTDDGARGPSAAPTSHASDDVRTRACDVLRWTGDPHSETLARWAAENPDAYWALLHDALRQLASRPMVLAVKPDVAATFQPLAPSLHAPVAAPAPTRRAGG